MFGAHLWRENSPQYEKDALKAYIALENFEHCKSSLTDMMITEYNIISAESKDKLVAAVNKAIKEGWQPYEGLVIPVIHVEGAKRPATALMQAMIKK